MLPQVCFTSHVKASDEQGRQTIYLAVTHLPSRYSPRVRQDCLLSQGEGSCVRRGGHELRHGHAAPWVRLQASCMLTQTTSWQGLSLRQAHIDT